LSTAFPEFLTAWKTELAVQVNTALDFFDFVAVKPWLAITEDLRLYFCLHEQDFACVILPLLLRTPVISIVQKYVTPS